MDYRKFGDRYFVRLDKGDEIIASLLTVCEREGLTVASVQGIGGCCRAAVGVFDTAKKEYNRHEVEAMLEMISLDGNLTVFEKKPYLHLHASFAYQSAGELRVLAGHLLKAVIGLTGELILTPVSGSIGRTCIDELGIRVWDFEKKG